MEELTPLLADERGLRRDALHEQVQLAFRNLAPVGSEDAPSALGYPELRGARRRGAFADVDVHRLSQLV